MSGEYRCPGEHYTISESIHLGRLANFYPACLGCAHRHETGTLGRHIVKQIQRSQQLAPSEPVFTVDGLTGVYRNQITPRLAWRLGAACGVQFGKPISAPKTLASVVLAGDGRPLVAELLAATAEGLRWSGCRVVEIGAATSACLVRAMAAAQADGAVLIGNPGSDPSMVGFKLWGPCHAQGALALGKLGAAVGPRSETNTPSGLGCALPLPADQLQTLAELLCRGVDRPTRRAGTATRLPAEETYLAELRDYFHALRPLKWVLDTTSQPWQRYVRRLSSTVACELVMARDFPLPPGGRRLASLRAPSAVHPTAAQQRTQRMSLLAQQVVAASANFGLWVDGDGESCALVDARGKEVLGEDLLVLLGRHLVEHARQSGATLPEVVVELETSQVARARLDALGVVWHTSPDQRAEMSAAVLATGAALGGGPSGRFWFASPRPGADVPLPSPDALRVLALVLTVLSQRDWTLHQALKEEEVIAIPGKVDQAQPTASQ